MGAQRKVGEFEAGSAAPPSPFPIEEGFVVHPFVKDRMIEGREFQVRLAERCLRSNTLVVVPTGLGKTLVAVLVAAETLRVRRGTVLFVAPTRPLALQHFETMQRLLKDEGLIQFFSGGVPPRRRQEEWGKGIFVVATPQTIRNDLEADRYDLSTVALVIFDEAHRAVGEYAYVDIAARLRRENPAARIVGLTASPGAKRQRVEDVAHNLGIDVIEARDTRSQDVVEYVQPVDVEVRFVELTPTLRRVAKPFQELLLEKEGKLRTLGLVRGRRPWGLTKKELIALQQALGRQASRGGGFVFGALHSAQLAYYALLCLEYVQTQGLDSLRRYLDRFEARDELKRNEKSFLRDSRVQQARELLAKPVESSHPKTDELLRVLQELLGLRRDALAIVFTQYRDTVASLVETLRAKGIAAERFVGQASRGEDEGMAQAEQHDVLARFSRREFNVLVSTSIGEEGIDVPQVDLVAFYEAVPSEIRAIQRRGRTGRTKAGRVVVLVAQGTVDEGYYYAQVRKEKRMKQLVGRFA